MKKLIYFAILVLVGVKTQAQVPNFVPQNGLIAWWPLDNSPTDTYTNNLGGSITGSPTAVIGHLGALGTAYQFNGNDYIQIADNPVLSNFNDMSISLWVKTATGSGVRALVTKWYQNVNCGGLSDTYGVYMTGNQVNYANVNEVWYGFPAPPFLGPNDFNNWTHIVATSDAVNGQKLYINAVLAATNASTSLGPICATTGPLMIGAETQQWSPPIQRYFTGALDDIGIWNRVLTLCEIENLYKSSFMYSPSMYGTAAVNITTLTGGSTTTVTANASSLPPTASYQWYQPGSPTFFSTQQSIAVSPTVATTYTVLAGAVSNCPGKQIVTIQPKKSVGIIESENRLTTVNFFPNPVTDKLFVTFSEALNNVDVVVRDVAGRILMKQMCKETNTLISFSSFSQGVYFVDLQKEGQILISEKIIKSN